MQKRGQITIFIIIGVIILIFVGFLILTNSFIQENKINSDKDNLIKLSSKTEAVKLYIGSCIDGIAKKSIFTLGRYGGQIELASNYFDSELFNANYVYYLGEKNAPSIEEMEKSLELLMERDLEKCVGEFNPEISEVNINGNNVNKELLSDIFVEQKGEVQADVKITKGLVVYNVQWPLVIKVKKQKKELVHFPKKEFLVDLNHIALFTQEFIDKIYLNPYLLDINYALKQNYTMDLAMFNDDTYVILITDNNSMIDYQPLKFLMAVKINTSKPYLLGD
jgi:hypothetical protein